MGFTESVKTCFSKYATFSGRASRSELWWYVLFVVIVGIVLSGIDTNVMHSRPGTGLLSGIFSLVTILPSLAVGVRRLHDTNRSGWWILIALVPVIGGLILIYFYIQDSDPNDNEFGPTPKAPAYG